MTNISLFISLIFLPIQMSTSTLSFYSPKRVASLQELVANFGHKNFILVGLEENVACDFLLCRRGRAMLNATQAHCELPQYILVISHGSDLGSLRKSEKDFPWGTCTCTRTTPSESLCIRPMYDYD